MHIPFGVSRLNQISDQTVSVILKKMLFQKYKIMIDKIKSTVVRFPHEAKILNEHFYYWVPGTGYKRFFLWITKISGINNIILINLDNKKIYRISIKINENIFDNDIIFSGEMIQNEKANYFMVEDLIVYECGDGEQDIEISNMNYIQRCNLIEEIITKYFIDDFVFNDICVKLKKPINLLSDVNKFPEIVSKSNNIYKNIRFLPNKVFYPNYDLLYTNVILSNNNGNNNGNSNDKYNTINNKKNIVRINNNNFELEKEYIFILKNSGKPDVYYLYFTEKFKNPDNEYIIRNNKIGTAYIHGKDISIDLKNKLLENEYILCNCKYNTNFNKWEPFELLNNKNIEDVYCIN